MRARLAICVTRVALFSVDLLLQLIGARFVLFLWFFRLAPPSLVAWVGRLRAIRACDYAIRRTPAYREFVRSHKVSPADVWRLHLPFTDKECYIDAFGQEKRCLQGKIPTVDVAIDESSGSSGTPYNWIRSLRERRTSHTFISHFARFCFGTDPSITVNTFSMGAWATGINMGIALQRNSIVKNTGPDLDKVFRTLDLFGPRYRYLICGYPPFLKHLIDVGLQRRFPLATYRLIALLGGEGNSEGLRDYLLRYFTAVYSGYGATDIEIGIAGETPITLAMRRAARRNGRLRRSLFGSDSRLPMLFQYNPLMHYIAVNEGGELMFTITRLNVLSPRIMYNIHDEGGVAGYAAMAARFRGAGLSLKDLAARTGVKPLLLPFLWVYGRKDSTVSVMGANIYPEDVEQCLYDEPELAKVAHSYCLALHEDADASVRPCFSFEIRGEITSALQAQFEERIVRRLRSLNADFRKAMDEYEGSAAPLIRLFALGTGPFADDARRIKQVRVVRS